MSNQAHTVEYRATIRSVQYSSDGSMDVGLDGRIMGITSLSLTAKESVALFGEMAVPGDVLCRQVTIAVASEGSSS